MQQQLNRIEYKVERILLLLQKKQVQEPEPEANSSVDSNVTPSIENYKFNRDHLDALHLSRYGYALSKPDSIRQKAIDSALSNYTTTQVSNHLYALWTIWLGRNSVYEDSIKKDIVYVESL